VELETVCQSIGQLARIEDECKMQNQIEKQTIPTTPAVFVQGQGGRCQDVKRCGYCDRLVRWTSVEGRNVAVNCDGSRHQCLTDGTAKRKQPARHARPSPDEVAAFLACEQGHESSSTEPTRDFEVNEKHNIAAQKAQTEAMYRFADAMLKVAKSNNALADSNRRLAKMYSRLAHAIELAGHPCR
jgi:hypothetical protein